MSNNFSWSKIKESVYNMKRLFSVLFLFCLVQSVCYSAPNYDPNNVTTEWDPTYNVQLRNKLEDEFDKRHNIDDHHMDGGPYAYYREVLVPYDLNKKKMKDLPQKQYKIETK